MKDRTIIAKIHERSVMEKFAKELIRQFQKNLGKTDIGQSGKLGNSFKYSIGVDKDRYVNRISISHLSYGTFVDMGVSNGVSLGDIGTQKIGESLLGRKIEERQAKRWYYKKIYGQTIRLAEVIMNTRGYEFRVAIEDALDAIPDVKITL
jgi:hypothetical protein